jgi:hypothetical protein
VNKIKEKKLDTIKSQIIEITDLVESSLENETKKVFDNNNVFENKDKDTFTLTKIIDYASNKSNELSEISFIKNELNIIKLMILEQQKVLETILLKKK